MKPTCGDSHWSVVLNDCLDTRDNWKRAAMKQNISVGEFYRLLTVINVEALPIPVNQPLFDLRKTV